jgi:HEAT repeat protein
MTKKRTRWVSSALAVSSLLAVSLGAASADEDPANVYSGRARVYRQLPPESLESLSTPEAIRAVSMPNVAPTKIWRVLEHGERVECLDCIPYVADLLYASHPKTREIGAWWLRRRIFGVFGPGEVYSQVIETLRDPEASEDKRAYAAEAIGEFLTHAGLAPVAEAAVSDPSAKVRLSAVNALRRMGHPGPQGELGAAMGDSDSRVRLAALEASVGLSGFRDAAAVLARLEDESPEVRRRAAQVVGGLRVPNAAERLLPLTSSDTEPDARVRAAAVFALGRIGDPTGRSAVDAAQNDSDPFVRDAARMALRRL